MLERLNIEISHNLAESDSEGHTKQTFRAELIDIAESIVLELVAVAMRWSGYCSAKWEDRQAILYGTEPLM